MSSSTLFHEWSSYSNRMEPLVHNFFAYLIATLIVLFVLDIIFRYRAFLADALSRRQQNTRRLWLENDKLQLELQERFSCTCAVEEAVGKS